MRTPTVAALALAAAALLALPDDAAAQWFIHARLDFLGTSTCPSTLAGFRPLGAFFSFKYAHVRDGPPDACDSSSAPSLSQAKCESDGEDAVVEWCALVSAIQVDGMVGWGFPSRPASAPNLLVRSTYRYPNIQPAPELRRGCAAFGTPMTPVGTGRAECLDVVDEEDVDASVSLDACGALGTHPRLVRAAKRTTTKRRATSSRKKTTSARKKT
ncbi:hypothetical protein DFJ74DRAFT_766719, partial [Hyaloraphidium curvatum]